MRLPVICGVIDRRVLVNYRVDPDVLAAIVPAPFRSQAVGGYGALRDHRLNAGIPPACSPLLSASGILCHKTGRPLSARSI
jgi:hypothetical protein